MKRVLLCVAIAIAFLAGYAVAAKAWPGVPDRDPYHGYFQNRLDTQGSPVLLGGIPSGVNSANTYIAFIEGKLNSGSARDKIGAAFIIDYQLGSAFGWTRSNPPTTNELLSWETSVRYAESQGWVSWFQNFSFTGNSYYQGDSGGGTEPVDDAFYYDTDVQQSIIFRNGSGQVVAVLKRSCGNPLTNGLMSGFNTPWTGSGRTTVVSSTATPGQSVVFSHYVKNLGPGHSQMYSYAHDSTTGAVTFAGPLLQYNPGQEIKVTDETVVIPNSAPPGAQYCRQVGLYWHASYDGTEALGTPVCVTVVVPAKLKAVMTATPRNIAAGDTSNLTPAISVASAGSPVDVTCTVTRTTYAPDGSVSGSAALPCVSTAGTSPITVSNGVTQLRANTYTSTQTTLAGTKVCDVMTITSPSNPAYFNVPADQTASDCTVIVKMPYVTFMGGDVWAGGNFAASNPACTSASSNIQTVSRQLPDGTLAGSGVEYNAFALGSITKFGSAGRAFVTPVLGSSSLTFSNINASNLGFYGAARHCIQDYASLYTTAAAMAPGTVDVAGQPTQSRHVTGNLTIHGVMPSGGRQVYLVDGDVTVDANVVYTPTYANAAAIPSLVIISLGNIKVASAVSQMDGVFITRGTFFTCDPKVEPATITTCPVKLTVNGAVAANKLDLFRTAGASGVTSAQVKDAAETFNYTPELFLSNALNTGQPTVTIVDQRELPPRY